MIAIRLVDGTLMWSARHETHIEFFDDLRAGNPSLNDDEFLGSVFGRINEDGEFVAETPKECTERVYRRQRRGGAPMGHAAKVELYAAAREYVRSVKQYVVSPRRPHWSNMLSCELRLREAVQLLDCGMAVEQQEAERSQ